MKKILSVILAAAMILTCLPLTVFAAAGDEWTAVHYEGDTTAYADPAAGSYVIVDGTRSLNLSGSTFSAGNVSSDFSAATVWSLSRNSADSTKYNIRSGSNYLTDNNGTLAVNTSDGANRRFTVESVSANKVTVQSSNGNYLYYNGNGFAWGSEPAELSLYVYTPGEMTTDYTYTLDTDGIDAGAKYLIVNHSRVNNADIAMTRNSDGSIGSTNVTKSNGTISMSSGNYDWTFTGSSSGYIRWDANNYYLDAAYDPKINSSQPSRTYSFSANNLSQGTYNLYFNWYGTNVYLGIFWGHFTCQDNTQSGNERFVELYKLTSEPHNTPGTAAIQTFPVDPDKHNGTPDLWASADGSVTVAKNSASSALINAVKASDVLTVLTSTSSDGSDPVTVSNSESAVSVDVSGVNTSIPGTYSAAVKYNGIQIGTVEVTVEGVPFELYTAPSSGQILKPGKYYLLTEGKRRLLLGSQNSNGGINASGTSDYTIDGNVMSAAELAEIEVIVANASENNYYFRTSSGRYISIGTNNTLASATLTNDPTPLHVASTNGNIVIGRVGSENYLNCYNGDNRFGVWRDGTSDINNRFILYKEKDKIYSLGGETEYTVSVGDNFNINDIIADTYVSAKQGSFEEQIPLTDGMVSYGWDSHYGGGNNLYEGGDGDPLNVNKPGTYFLYVNYDGNIIGRVTVKVEPEEPVRIVPGVEENFTVKVFNYGHAINDYRNGNDNDKPLDFFEIMAETVDGNNGQGSTRYQFTTQKRLGSDGCPVIYSNRLGKNASLGYLFADDMGGDGPTGFVQGRGTATEYDPHNNSDYQSMRFDVLNENGEGSGLFQRDDEGYYYYNSGENAAYFNQETSKFELYDYTMVPSQGGRQSDDLGNFFPFNLGHVEGNMNDQNSYGKEQYQLRGPIKYGTDWEDNTSMNDSWFGLSVGFDFMMPIDGTINGQDMVYHFSGDDDLWLYIDEALVLDMGGCHGVYNGSINFATGEVVYETNSAGSKQTIHTTIAQCFRDAYGSSLDTSILSGDTLADLSEHSIKFFYMERGGNISDCMIDFNIPPEPLGDLRITKAAENFADDEEFSFVITDENGVPYSDVSYIFSEKEGTGAQFISSTDENGIFSITASQFAQFSFPYRTKVKIKELTSDSFVNTVTSCKVDNTAVTLTSDLQTPEMEIPPYAMKTVDFENVNVEIKPDVIVIDYGKSILCSPLENDAGATGLTGLSLVNAQTSSGNTVTTQNGVFRIQGSNVVFSPFSYMSSINRVRYYATVKTQSGTQQTLSSTISVIPATTVYYEDDFGGSSANGGLYIQYSGDWVQVADDGTETDTLTANTDVTDRQDRGEVGQGHVPYGYDSSYDDCTMFSNGSAAMVEGSVSIVNGQKQFDAWAEFTFTGTGFDIISRTDLNCGTVSAYITGIDNPDYVDNTIVVNKGVQNLYQIPVLSYTGLPYGSYKVRINVNAPMRMLGITGSTFYLDAIRIYDPMGTSTSENAEFNEANQAYLTDKEANAYVASIRDYILTAEDLGPDEISGAVYVDTINNEYTSGGILDKTAINDILQIGPNEEVYLTPGKGVGFVLECTGIPDSVQLEIKVPSPMGDTASLRAQTLGKTVYTDFEVSSAEEMFYDITDAVSFTKVKVGNTDYYRAIVVITNGLENVDESEVISITNIKMTYSEAVQNVVSVSSVSESIVTASLDNFLIDEEGNTVTLSGEEVRAVEEEKTQLVSINASWDVYCDVFNTVYTQHQATLPNYDVTVLDGTGTVAKGEKKTFTFTSGQFVDSLKITDENGADVNAEISSVLDESRLYTEDCRAAKTWTVTVSDQSVGTHTYTVAAANGEGGTAAASLTVQAPAVVGLSVVSAPKKTSYYRGEKLDTAGLKLKAVYSDGTEEIITSGYTLDRTTANRLGNVKVGVSFGGVATGFTVKSSFSLKVLIRSIFGR